RLRFSGPKTSIICSPMTSLKTSIKTITYLSDIGCLEIQGASLLAFTELKRIALDLKDNLSDEAKFNIELRNAIKLKRNIIMGKGA
ncbi:hypothetical protein KJE07_21520, partial [Escherichia marmotae]|nr:hypothetical protein [Escherichia marmotae]